MQHLINIIVSSRARLKESWVKQAQENEKLRELNGKLLAERAFFRTAISEHLKKCPDAADLSELENVPIALYHIPCF